LSSMVSFEEEYEVEASVCGSLCQTSKLESSTLPNGITVLSTGAGAASSAVLVKVDGVGTAFGPKGAARAARVMAFKSANGKTDLKIQRELELASSTPHALVTKSSFMVGVEGLPEFMAEATDAVAVAAGVGRSAFVEWEFKESIEEKTPSLDPLQLAVEAAAYGEGSPWARSSSKVAGLSALETFEFLRANVDASPVTVVGLGLSHADVLSYAAKSFASLPARSSSKLPEPTFLAGGFSAKASSSDYGMAACVPVSSPVLGGVLAAALTTPAIPVTYAEGLLVAKSSTSSKADLVKALLNKEEMTDLSFATAKAAYKTKALSASGFDLAVAIANGLDNDTVVRLVEGLTLADAQDALSKYAEPAFAVLAPADD